MTKRVYSSLLDPTMYPDFTRRPFRVPTWKVFGNTTQFTTLRVFTIKNNRLVNFREDLDLYERLGLGRVIWPVFQTMFASNFKDLVAEIRKRDLFVFDFWGHVPGSGYESMWSHVMPPPGMVAYLQKQLGDRFLGIDNGEQDGRYVGAYAGQQCPAFADRFRQYLNFQRHFEQMGNDLGNKLSTLVSLCFGHYFLKEGNHILIGAETGQALPNSQIYYAFIRGAGKQYGVHWFGNASIFNRWGYKSYESTGEDGGYRHGPTEGSSLSLLRRLLYTHYLYNCVAIGFEQSWLMGDNTEKRLKGLPVPMEQDRSRGELSPVGKIQAAAGKFVRKHGQPGVMVTPIALMLDHFSGWVMPRHLYSGKIYQVWGAMPYEAGDYFTHDVLSMLYPGYENSSYFRDERGFLSSTPYGDSADVLLSDAPGWIMRRYNVIVAAGKLNIDAELRAKFDEFVEQGGHLVVTAENARELWPELIIGPASKTAGARVTWADGSETREVFPVFACKAVLPERARVLVRCAGTPLVASLTRGKGSITLLLSAFGLGASAASAGSVANKIEMDLANPYPLAAHAHKALDRIFSAQTLFSVGDGLGYITCRKGPGEYTLGVFNPGMCQRAFKIVSHCGKIRKISEWPIDQSAKQDIGYWPTGMEKHDGGKSGAATIAGGDIRIFKVSVTEKAVRTIAPTASQPVRDRILAIRSPMELKEAILAYPTFCQHFNGVKIEWTYLRDRDSSRLEQERDWLQRQKVQLIIDFSHGINFYPGLTLLDTLLFRYKQSVAAIDGVLDKMKLIGAGDAVICLHRKPENHCSDERASDRFLAGVRDLCRRAAKRNIVLHLQCHPGKWFARTADMLAFIKTVKAGNLRFALNAGHAAMQREELQASIALAGNLLGMVLLSAPLRDDFAQTYDAHAPLHPPSSRGAALSGLRRVPLRLDLRSPEELHAGGLDMSVLKGISVPLVLDADYRTWDDVYRDRQLV